MLGDSAFGRFMNPPSPKQIGVKITDYNKAYFPIYATPTGPYKFPLVIRGLATIATTTLVWPAQSRWRSQHGALSVSPCGPSYWPS